MPEYNLNLFCVKSSLNILAPKILPQAVFIECYLVIEYFEFRKS